VAVETPEPVNREDRILTIPNLITLARLLCLPVYLWLLLGVENRAAAAGLLAGLGATDWVDGYIARHFDQVSNLGKVIDPVADRFLFFVAITGMLLVDPPGAPVWFAVVVLVREVVVGGSTVLLALLGARRIDVSWFGKAGTFGLMFAFPLFLWGSGSNGNDVAWVLGWLAGIPALILSLYAAVLYVPAGLSALREGRQAREIAEARP
jgi:cardiolipin synthase